MAENEKNSNKIYLQFAKKLMYNRRTIPKKDKNGNPIELINIGFPISSKYYGCYISVNVNKIKDSPFSIKMASTDLYEDATYSICYYVKEMDGEKRKEILEKYKKLGFKEHNKYKYLLSKQIPTIEIKAEFDLWKKQQDESKDKKLAKMPKGKE